MDGSLCERIVVGGGEKETKELFLFSCVFQNFLIFAGPFRLKKRNSDIFKKALYYALFAAN